MNTSAAKTPASMDPAARTSVAAAPSVVNVAGTATSTPRPCGSRGRVRSCGGISDTLIDADESDDGDPFQETPESYIIAPKCQAQSPLCGPSAPSNSTGVEGSCL